MNYIGLQTFVEREVKRFLRVSTQTLLSPWINAVLYIFVFGFIVGTRIQLIEGIRYIEFVLPGILMLNVIGSSFSQTSSSLYFQRFARHIEEILVAPLSNLEIVLGYIVSGVIRGFVVGIGIYCIALLFGSAHIVHPFAFLFYSLSVAVVFSFLGLLIGLWAESFEQLTILNTFVITPLTFLGGVFNSVSMLPEKMRLVSYFNPFFYFVDGLRYSMTGINESNLLAGGGIIVGLMLVLMVLTVHLFNKGWKIRT